VCSVFYSSRFGLLRASNLPLGFIKRNAYRCCQVQAPRVGFHGNCQTGLRIFPQQRLGQTSGFPSENQKIPILEYFIPIYPRRLCGKIEVSPCRLRGLEFGEGCPAFHIAEMPVIHSCTAKCFFIQRESQRLDQMQSRSGSKTQARDVSRIRWNLWLDKHDVKHDLILLDLVVWGNSITHIVPRGTWGTNDLGHHPTRTNINHDPLGTTFRHPRQGEPNCPQTHRLKNDFA